MEVRVTGKVGATGRVRSRDGGKSQPGRWRCATAVAVAVIVVVTAAVVPSETRLRLLAYGQWES